MLLKIAIRHILAYKSRSIVTMLLTCVTTTLLVFASAYMDGSHNKMIESAVEIYPGYLQITNKEFRDQPSFENLIFDTKYVQDKLSDISGIAVMGARFESFVLFTSEEKAVGGMFTGIEPEKEADLSRLKKSLMKGDYLEKDDYGKVYMGHVFAKKLDVGVGDKLAFVGTGADYSFAADHLTVKGLFKTGLFEFDASTAFVNKSYFDEVMAAENISTHYIVLPDNPVAAPKLAESISMSLGPSYQSASWQETMSGLVSAMRIDSIFGYITLGILFIVIFFVVMIYTLLTVFARVNSLGIMRAVGTSQNQLLTILIYESIILGGISVIVGGILGGALAYYFQIHPIVFTGYEEQFKQYGLAASSMPSLFSPITIARDMVIMFILSILATVYPIIKINRLRPIEAIRHV